MLLDFGLLDVNPGELFHRQNFDSKDGWTASAAMACFYAEDNSATHNVGPLGIWRRLRTLFLMFKSEIDSIFCSSN
jgi:hypothetical protein